MKPKAYTKYDLVKELAQDVNVPRAIVAKFLLALKEIAYREAANGGFTLPDICKIDVVHKKQRRMTNPRTRQPMLIAEHDSPRFKVLRKAKQGICPQQGSLIIPLDSNNEPVAMPTIEPTTAPAHTITKDDFKTAVSFLCPICHEAIEAPTAAAGMKSECPACGKTFVIPDKSEPNTIHGSKPLTPADPEAAAKAEQDMLNCTIRIDLSTLEMPLEAPTVDPSDIIFKCPNCQQELVAPAQYAGIEAECDACGATCTVPDKSNALNAKKQLSQKELAQTMRISLVDL